MSENKETIVIEGKTYYVEDLSEKAKELIGNVNAIQGELNHVTLQAEIFNFSKSVIIQQLVSETAELVEVITEDKLEIVE